MDALGWFSTTWDPRYLEIRISLLGMAVSLWLALFLVRRPVGTPVALQGACTLLLMALYFAFEAMLYTPGITAGQYESLLRTQALTIPSSLAGWIILSFLIRSRKRITPTVRTVWLVVGFIGVSQALLRALTDWYLEYSNIQPSSYSPPDWWVPRGPGFVPYIALVISGLLWSVYNIIRLFCDEAGSVMAAPSAKGFWPLSTGGLLLSTSVIYLMVISVLNTGAPKVIGLAGLTISIMALGLSVFRHNVLVEEGRDITIDFLHSLVGVSAVLALYVGIIYLADGFQNLGAGPLVGIVAALVITHSLH
ncbi:MAG: hypothetical protein M1358_17215, partial [Chloroflexi bacterium]|nr:hypothetical protein [Chloroflexota bacterium]